MSDIGTVPSVGTARKITIVLPDGTVADWLTVGQALAFHGYPAYVPRAVLPVRRRRLVGWFTRWRATHLFETVRRHGRVVTACGGRVSRLDLTGLGTSVRDRASLRWRAWQAQVAAHTPNARPWELVLAAHLKKTTDPDEAVANARREFEAQPRVLAMLAYAGYPFAVNQFNPYELEAYQAGEAVFSTVHWQSALVGDGLITPTGRLLEPASDSLADRLRYCTQAMAVIAGLSPHQHLAHVAASRAPEPATPVTAPTT